MGVFKVNSPAEKMAAEKRAPHRRKYTSHVCTIAQLRESLGLTLRDVQHGTGLSNAFISQVEHGCEISLTNARQLAVFFGQSLDDLWPQSFSAPEAEEPTRAPQGEAS